MVDLNMAKGNPGALQFICEAYAPGISIAKLARAEQAFQRMQDNKIEGAALYMLWNDCCDRNTSKAIEIMLINDIEDIKKHINLDGGRGIPYECE